MGVTTVYNVITDYTGTTSFYLPSGPLYTFYSYGTPDPWPKRPPPRPRQDNGQEAPADQYHDTAPRHFAARGRNVKPRPLHRPRSQLRN